VGVPINFSSLGSNPGAGESATQTITYLWDFGDGATSTAANPAHAYASAGTRLVTLTVTDNGSPNLSSSITTTASVVTFIAAEVIPDGNDGHIKTNGNGAQNFGLEVFSRNVTDLDLNSIRLSTTYPNAGTVSEVAISPKGVHVGDIDKDLIFDLDFQLRASQVKPLLIHVPNGTLVTLVFTVQTISDAVTVRGTIDLVKSGSSSVSSASAGNPFKLDTKIQYTLRDSGPVQIRIYSVNGRLVRTLREEVATPGAYEVRWNGKADNGATAPSGIYFVSVKQGAESSQTRIVLAR
jgi:PKD repeat protein